MKQIGNHDQVPSMPGALEALRRARRVAEDTARQTRTALVVMIDGKIVRVYPAEGAAPDAAHAPDVR